MRKMRHKHDAIHVRTLADGGIEECAICEKRREYAFIGRNARLHYSKWVNKEESAKYNLSWLWKEVEEQHG